MSRQASKQKQPPVVLAIGGHDPSGGAGLQADIETLAALGCHAATAVTALTVQDTSNVKSLHAVAEEILRAQIEAVLDDMPVAVVKVGLLGSLAAVRVVADIMDALPHLPLVLDPVLAAGGGAELSDAALRKAIRDRLLPRTWLLTPNAPEAMRLAGESSPEAAALALLAAGARQVLVTGGHDAGAEVVNRYFGPDEAREQWRWPRLEGDYHGSGCTLASACAALMARELPVVLALRLAQAYTQDALASATRPGRGQAIPRRVLIRGAEQ